MGTPAPFVRFLALAGRQEPDAVFGFLLPCLPDMSTSPWLVGATPRERLQESLQLQVRLIQALWRSGITALELRFIGTGASPAISIAILCRVRRPSHVHTQHFHSHCLSLAQYLQQLFADSGFELAPLVDEASLTHTLSPFRIQVASEIRKQEEVLVIQDVYIENEVYATYPWQWAMQNRLRLLEALVRRRSDCLISIYLEPTQLGPQEQHHLSYATSLPVKKLLWSAGSQGEAIYDLYTAYAQKLRQPYLIRISVASARPETNEQIGRLFIDELSGNQNLGTQPIQLFTQNQQEWQAACQSIMSVSWSLWGPNDGIAMPGTARLRYLVDAEMASMAFRIPVANQPNVAGVPVRMYAPSANQHSPGHSGQSLPTPATPVTPVTTFAGTTPSNAPTEIMQPKSTTFDISRMRGLGDLVGQTLGACQIEALLGKGGFGAVYRARQPRLNRVVAIKIILSTLLLAGTEEEQRERNKMLQRFDREAQALARMDHPHILPLYEYEQQPFPYLVMPYMTGGSLADELQTAGHRPMLTREVAAILAQVASALDHAHQQRLVHRDLKPPNLLRHSDGRILLSDFGIVQFEDTEMTPLTTNHASPYTQAYASPEQHQGQPIDYRTDIYSLGVIIYELLCGQRPFKVPYQHVYATPPPFHTFGIEIPPVLEAVVHKALSKRPEDRYQSAGAMATAFSAAMANI